MNDLLLSADNGQACYATWSPSGHVRGCGHVEVVLLVVARLLVVSPCGIAWFDDARSGVMMVTLLWHNDPVAVDGAAKMHASCLLLSSGRNQWRKSVPLFEVRLVLN